jgi:NhaP-type Na+/H+ or K+/H+ antiporter
MKLDPVIILAMIVGLGMLAQWLAWSLRMPSILFLLVFGFLAGPVSGVLAPDQVFGDLLFPLVSVSVALILFEGGLTLRFKEYKSVGAVVLSLITVGVVATGVVAGLAAWLLLGMSWQMAMILGAILTVTGPTVIGPLLRHVRPAGRLSHILKWEGIMIDPVGALLAVIAFDIVYLDQVEHAGTLIIAGLAKTIILGGAIGFLGAKLLLFLLKRFWVPDMLKESITLSLVIAAFSLSNAIQHEAGLFAVTIMGLFLDNQQDVMVKDIVNFKETLRVLLISSLFIILSARIEIEQLEPLLVPGLLFLLVLVLFARPLSVFLSTINSKLNFREKLFLSWMAPRGIVAAAVASLFSLRLKEAGVELAGVDVLAPITFLVIAGTVTIYGLTAKQFASAMGLTQAEPQGVLIFGAHPWAREIAAELQEREIPVFLVDSNRRSVNKAKMAGLNACYGNALSERSLDEINLDGIGKLLALTSNDEANSLAALHFAEVFDREELYQLIPEKQTRKQTETDSPVHLRGRYLFGPDQYFTRLAKQFRQKVRMTTVLLTKEFGYDDFMLKHRGKVIPMFLLREDGSVLVFTTDKDLKPQPGQRIIAVVPESETNEKDISDE